MPPVSRTGEAQPIAALRQLLALPPIAHKLAVSGVLEGRSLSICDGAGELHRRGILVIRARLHGLVALEAGRPLNICFRESGHHGQLDPGFVDRSFLLCVCQPCGGNARAQAAIIPRFILTLMQAFLTASCRGR